MVRRLSLWIRAHPIIGDASIAVFVLLFDYVFIGDTGRQGISGVTWVGVGALLVAPLLVRRRFPIGAAIVIAFGGVMQLLTHQVNTGMVQLRPADLALGFALYTLVAYLGRKPGLIYGSVLLFGTIAWALLTLRHASIPATAPMAFVGLMIFTIFFIAGEYYGARRAYSAEVERRLALLETERDQQARIAVGEERARIARELHDVVAHAVSVIIVQADGASYAIRNNPELAESAVETISTTGRTALAELRRLLGVLREDDTEAELTPQPDATGLSRLADQIGIPVRLQLSGDIDGLPAGIGLNLYRIIQEALTNTLKHAGASAAALVTVRRGEEDVEVSIEDNGSGAPTAAFREVSGGNGLIGMRERATMHGGELEAGPRETGGWRVHASIPLQPS
ncbi:sensor histidine kinase [Sciscionella sediminilitoris]|uniref:sensor histidine kinase n=1 Tax=Sciscionella sediminilitoris TaxID=1445613 RepID=UPI0009EB7507|nr:sensor histidine kinase [Sciscionella sp. SE31]